MNANFFLKYEIVDADQMNAFEKRLRELLGRVRVNAVALVDSFDWSDSNLNSSLGVYNGNVYEKLFEFAQNSRLNSLSENNPAVEKYLKPFVEREKQRVLSSNRSKL